MKGESTRNRCGHSLRGSSGSTHTRPRGHTRPARQSPCTRCVRNSSPSRCHRHAQSTACTRAPPPRWRSADSSARRASLMPRSTGYGTRCTRTRSAPATRSRRGLVRGPLAWAQRVPEVTIGVWAHPPHKALPRWRCPRIQFVAPSIVTTLSWFLCLPAASGKTSKQQPKRRVF